jgi:hypothetical protein
MGKSKYKSEPPVLTFHSGEKYGGMIYGEYYNDGNEIKIWWETHSTSKEITSTLIHEYTHYLQYWPWYIRYMKTYSYDKNPYEIEATNQANFHEPDISRLSTDDEWKKLIRRDKKLKRIYESVESKIIINF